jgi:hypothetical protein
MSISPINHPTPKTLFRPSRPSPLNLSEAKTPTVEFIDIPRPPTPKIFTSTRIDGNLIPQHQVIMTLVSCKCQKLAMESKCFLRDRLSPTNEEIKINYKGKKFNILLCGEGTYYLVDDKINKKLNLFKEVKTLTLPCCSFQGIYFTPVFL